MKNLMLSFILFVCFFAQEIHCMLSKSSNVISKIPKQSFQSLLNMKPEEFIKEGVKTEIPNEIFESKIPISKIEGIGSSETSFLGSVGAMGLNWLAAMATKYLLGNSVESLGNNAYDIFYEWWNGLSREEQLLLEKKQQLVAYYLNDLVKGINLSQEIISNRIRNGETISNLINEAFEKNNEIKESWNGIGKEIQESLLKTMEDNPERIKEIFGAIKNKTTDALKDIVLKKETVASESEQKKVETVEPKEVIESTKNVSGEIKTVQDAENTVLEMIDIVRKMNLRMRNLKQENSDTTKTINEVKISLAESENNTKKLTQDLEKERIEKERVENESKRLQEELNTKELERLEKEKIFNEENKRLQEEYSKKLEDAEKILKEQEAMLRDEEAKKQEDLLKKQQEEFQENVRKTKEEFAKKEEEYRRREEEHARREQEEKERRRQEEEKAARFSGMAGTGATELFKNVYDMYQEDKEKLRDEKIKFENESEEFENRKQKLAQALEEENKKLDDEKKRLEEESKKLEEATKQTGIWGNIKNNIYNYVQGALVSAIPAVATGLWKYFRGNQSVEHLNKEINNGAPGNINGSGTGNGITTNTENIDRNGVGNDGVHQEGISNTQDNKKIDESFTEKNKENLGVENASNNGTQEKIGKDGGVMSGGIENQHKKSGLIGKETKDVSSGIKNAGQKTVQEGVSKTPGSQFEPSGQKETWSGNSGPSYIPRPEIIMPEGSKNQSSMGQVTTPSRSVPQTMPISGTIPERMSENNDISQPYFGGEQLHDKFGESGSFAAPSRYAGGDGSTSAKNISNEYGPPGKMSPIEKKVTHERQTLGEDISRLPWQFMVNRINNKKIINYKNAALVGYKKVKK